MNELQPFDMRCKLKSTELASAVHSSCLVESITGEYKRIVRVFYP